MDECACALSENVLICMERGGRSVFIDVVRGCSPLLMWCVWQ